MSMPRNVFSTRMAAKEVSDDTEKQRTEDVRKYANSKVRSIAATSTNDPWVTKTAPSPRMVKDVVRE